MVHVINVMASWLLSIQPPSSPRSRSRVPVLGAAVVAVSLLVRAIDHYFGSLTRPPRLKAGVIARRRVDRQQARFFLFGSARIDSNLLLLLLLFLVAPGSRRASDWNGQQQIKVVVECASNKSII